MKHSISAAATALLLVSMSATTAEPSVGKPAFKADAETALAITQEIVAAGLKQNVRSLLARPVTTLPKIERPSAPLVADQQSEQKAGDI
jgi:hypothetical protein